MTTPTLLCVCVCVCLSVCLSVCVSVCLSVSMCMCRWTEEYRRSNLKLDRAALTESLVAVRSLSEPKRVFCTTCSQLLPSTAVSPDHTPHQLSYGVDDTMLAQPSRLLTPLDNNKSSAVSSTHS